MNDILNGYFSMMSRRNLTLGSIGHPVMDYDHITKEIEKNNPNLTLVDISQGVGVRSLRCMIGNTHVSSLKTRNNSISSVDPLCGNTTLQKIDISGNLLTSLAMTSCIVKLVARNNRLETLEGIEGMKCLEHLDVSENLLTSISPIAGCPRILTLKASRNKLDSLEGVENLKRLEHLNVSRNHLSSLKELGSIASLTKLVCNGNVIGSLNGIASSKSLIKLVAYLCSIADVSCLKGVTTLQTVKLGFNHIADISSLASLPHLKELEVTDNNLEDRNLLDVLSSTSLISIDLPHMLQSVSEGTRQIGKETTQILEKFLAHNKENRYNRHVSLFELIQISKILNSQTETLDSHGCLAARQIPYF